MDRNLKMKLTLCTLRGLRGIMLFLGCFFRSFSCSCYTNQLRFLQHYIRLYINLLLPAFH